MIPNSRKMILEPAPLRPPAETSLLKETNTTIPKTTLNYTDWLEAEDKRLGR